MNELTFNQFYAWNHLNIRYIALEVENGRKYDTKADIYSLGIISRYLIHINYDINDYDLYFHYF
jgi:hypothetical protein